MFILGVEIEVYVLIRFVFFFLVLFFQDLHIYIDGY